MAKLHVKVTDDDIMFGIPGEPDACPIARAVKRTLDLEGEAFLDVLVDDYGIHIYYPHSQKTFNAAIIECFIDDFDEYNPVSPIEFDADEVDQPQG